MRRTDRFVAVAVVALTASVALRAQDPAPRSPAPPASLALLPTGDGRDVVFRVCSECHALERILGTRENYDGWVRIVNDMASRGAAGTDEDFDKIVAYLTEHFGRQPKPAPKPNFSGTWRATDPPVGAVLGAQVVVVQSETAITLTYGGRETVYTFDGTETDLKNTGGGTVTARAKWDAGKLTLTTVTSVNGRPTEATMVWSLDAAGDLVVESSSGGGPAVSTARTIYKRQPESAVRSTSRLDSEA
jgi:hypothetical protein